MEATFPKVWPLALSAARELSKNRDSAGIAMLPKPAFPAPEAFANYDTSIN